MFSNYLKVALRNISRHKGYSFVIVAGMSVGIAAFLVIMVFAISELSWENFHLKRDRIVRVSIEFGSGGNRTHFAGAMAALGPALVDQLPEVENAVRFRRDSKAMLRVGEKQFREPRLFFVDSSVFELFSFVPVYGNAEHALREPFSLVLTEELARKFFGVADPIGQTITYRDSIALQVTAVIRDIPANTLLRTDLMVSYSSLEPMGLASSRPWNQWGTDQTYLLLTEGVCLDSLYQQLDRVLLENTNEWFSEHVGFRLQRLADIHLTSQAVGEFGPVGDIKLVYLLLSVAVLVLVIACLNYINLATARVARRLKEIGVRKVIGAARYQLIGQVLTESLVVATLSGLIGLTLYEVIFSPLMAYVGNNAADYESIRYLPLALLFGTVLLVGLVVGCVPAWSISGISAVGSVKDGRSTAVGKAGLRRALVITQFTLSIGLISGAYVVYSQLDYMKNSDLGFDKKNVVLVSFPRGEEFTEKYTLIKNELLQVPGVTSVSGAYTVPGINSREQMGIRKQGAAEDESRTVRAVAVDKDYLEVLGLDLIDGQSLAAVTDISLESAVIFNQTAVSHLQLDDPVRMTIYRPGRDGMVPATVVGVIEDFHLGSLRREIEPLMLYVDPGNYYYVAIRIGEGDLRSILTAIERKWQQVCPDIAFRSSYLEDIYSSLYQSEQMIGELLAIFAALAVTVSCLGLFGLAAYSAEQRTKEVGIRKVLGASVLGIIQLLCREFVILVAIANIVAWPLTYYAISRWLENFAYQTSVGPGMFVKSGALALVLALATVSYQAAKAALANPVDSLRHE
jgi:putative ABC transport system permease protein